MRRALPLVALGALLLSGCAVTYPEEPGADTSIEVVTPSAAPTPSATVAPSASTDPEPIVAGGVVDLSTHTYAIIRVTPGSTTRIYGSGVLTVMGADGVSAEDSEDGSVAVTVADNPGYLVVYDEGRGHEIDIEIEVAEE